MRTKLQPGETVALIVRKHWLVLVKPALFFAGVLLYLYLPPDSGHSLKVDKPPSL
jgi:hypothetical protein